jgi:hypothetical protein
MSDGWQKRAFFCRQLSDSTMMLPRDWETILNNPLFPEIAITLLKSIF